eukprot:Blabericola_migrator_1__1837@NODE_14_length_24048_cov_80_277428_g11_i0_p4_GENE_NODE_14_length_24048_cov_80_277428_g11_i0NODE_14_length_24048_cov_80_277428_g11_i0_p4_ORF_typecomplete_len1123_score207_87RNB/PF00773_19/8_8e112OB_Dis3/PF17849_1/4_2e14Rrp44_CSD1/PF17216_3/7_5e13CSD2/PF17876_1/34CSD2/PF17876_1/4_1e07Rrp44_S1/PF17215_3/4e05_NODE_14_length_24048_cov_80_277428_g11_i02343602
MEKMSMTAHDEEAYWAQFMTADKAKQEKESNSAIVDITALDLVLEQLQISASSLRHERPTCEAQVTLKRTRRGRLRLESREMYLQEEFPCGVEGCSLCFETTAPTPEVSRLSDDRVVYVLDEPICTQQADFLWDDPAINNCVILQSTLDEVQRVARRSHKRLLRLTGFIQPIVGRGVRGHSKILDDQDEVPPGRAFLLFPNENVARTHTPHHEKEDPAARRLASIVRFANWFVQHRLIDRDARAEAGMTRDPDGVICIILTSTPQRRQMIMNEGCLAKCVTLDEFIESVKSQFPNVGEKLSAFAEPQIIVSKIPSTFKALQTTGTIDLVTRDALSGAADSYGPHLKAAVLNDRIQKGEAYRGVLKTSYRTWRCGTVMVESSSGKEAMEVKVLGRLNMNRAVHGDVVVVSLIDPKTLDAEALADDAVEDSAKVYGRVIGIVKRNWETYCGTIRKGGTGEECHFIPVNPRYPDIIIKTGQRHELEDQRIVVGIDKWDRRSVLPRGHWIERIGPAGDPETEAKVILRDYHVITRAFPPAVLKCLPPASYEIPDDEARKRLDLRLKYCFCDSCRSKRNGLTRKPLPQNMELLGTPCLYTKEADWPLPLTNWHSEKKADFKQIAEQRKNRPEMEEYVLDTTYTGAICVSVDPDTCVDIDDALSLKYLANGNYEVGVHIADVSHFVKSGTAIDREAAERCTTVYLVNQRTDMLPKLLSADLCSIKSGTDRLCFSVFWEMTKKGDIVRTSFHKTVIHSVAALNYRQAQDMIDDKRDNSPVAIRLRVMNKLAKALKKRRAKNGAVELASTEVKFDFKQQDERKDKPSGVAAYVHYATHSLVEEFMLLANVAVAQRIVQSFPDCSVLRRHPPPKADGLAHLAKVLASKGMKFEFGSNAQLAESLNRCQIKGDPVFNKMLRSVTVQFMNQAVYYCTGEIQDEESRRHYALAANLYTHFTSPIRRYADVLVHRLLAASLNIETLSLSASTPIWMSEQCDKLTARARNAQFCSRASSSYYAYQYFSQKGKVSVNGIIKQVRKNCCFIIVPSTGVQGQALVDTDKYKFDPDTETLVSTDERLTIFDHVWVEVECNDDDYRFTITYKIVKKMNADEILKVAREAECFVTGSGEIPI